MRDNLKDEEVRKLQFTGRSSYILSLPKYWVKEMNLAAGDSVTVSRLDKLSLLISPKSARAGKKPEALVLVSPDHNPSSLVREIVSIYLIGYSNVQIRSKKGRFTTAQRNAVKNLVRTKLVGTEIVDDSSEKVSLQVLLSEADLSVENAVRRMHLIATAMHKDALTALGEQNTEIAQEVILSDDEVDRFSLYVIRQLKFAVQNQSALETVGLKDRRDCLGYRLIIKSLERIADHASGIAEIVIESKIVMPQQVMVKIREYSKYALETLDSSMTALFKRDYALADKVVEIAQQAPRYEKAILELSGKFRAKELSSLRVVLEDIRRTAEYAGDIAEIVLNLTVEKVVTEQISSLQRDNQHRRERS
ncbi:MAG: phosphate uptake regulator PhoU [Thaumarchaeota archaeon]|nr:phosphate uptake regulator PhoU [Nitrososphaerota archaeon]